MFENIELFLNKHPSDNIAAKDCDRSITYAELLLEAKQVSENFCSERSVIILECNPSIDWLIAYLATLMRNHVALLLPNDKPDLSAHFSELFGARYIVNTDNGISITQQNNETAILNDDLCIMLSTSGSTGSPKCVKLSHTNLTSNAASIAEYLNITTDDVGVVNLPTNYSYGLSIVNSHLYMGGAILFNQYSVVDDEFWQLCDKEKATSFAGVPHSYELLSRTNYQTKIPPSMRYFTQAGGKLSRDKVIEFSDFAKQNSMKFFVMYGQTEASPRISYLSPEIASEYPDSIGQAIPGGELKVLNEAGEDEVDGAEGELAYFGPNVMMGYARNRSDLSKSKELNCLMTGDIAKKLENGLFVITGRKSRFIKLFGNRVSLDQVEVILKAEKLNCVATGHDDKLIVYTVENEKSDLIEKHLSEVLKIPTSSLQIVFGKNFPTLQTGKIDYASILAIASTNSETDTSSVIGIFSEIFGAAKIDQNKSFSDLGGDSLNYVKVSIYLEELIDELPENWVHLKIFELQKLANNFKQSTVSNKPKVAKLANVDTLRAIVCFLVVAYHVFGSTPDFGLNIAKDSPYRSAFQILDLIRMPLFTALAGMLFIAMAPNKLEFPKVVLNRVSTLLVPALVVSIIYFYLRSLIGKEVGELTTALLHGYMHLWYLYALFLMVVVIGGIQVLFKPSLTTYMILIPVTFVVSRVVKEIDFLRVAEAIELTPYFILGIVIYQHTQLFLKKRVIYAAALITALGCVLKALLFLKVVNLPFNASFLWFVVSTSFIVTCYRFVPKLSSIQWVGVYTYAIYLWHPMANASARTLLTKLGLDNQLFLFIVGLFVGVLVPIMMYKAANILPKVVRQSLMGR